MNELRRPPLRAHFFVGMLGTAAGLATGFCLGRSPARPAGRSAAPVDAPTPAEAALERAVPEVDLCGVPFDEALNQLQKAANFPLGAHWSALALQPGDRERPVTLRARNILLAAALGDLLGQVPSAARRAVYVPAGDSVVVTAPPDPDVQTTVVRSYELDDLPDLGPPGAARGSAVAGIQPLPGEDGRSWDMFCLVRAAVDPTSWEGRGGVGRGFCFAHRLVISQSWENHRRIAALLSELRRGGIPPASATPDLRLWNEGSKSYVAAAPGVVEAALRRKLPEVRFDAVPLSQAVEKLGEQAGVGVVAEWEEIAADGRRPETPVTLHLRDVTLADAIGTLFGRAEGPKIAYGPEGAGS